MDCQVKIRGPKAIDYPCQDIDLSDCSSIVVTFCHYRKRVRYHNSFIVISMGYIRKSIVVMRIVVKGPLPQFKYTKLLENQDCGNVVMTPI